jgi:hypothetical protein
MSHVSQRLSVIQTRSCRCVLALLALLLVPSVSASAQSWLDAYLKRVAEQQAKQPHWATPLFTTTPRIDQRIRYDVIWQRRSSGLVTENIGNGKGISFVPARNIEVAIGIPPYYVHNDPKRKDGWGDETFQVKYRFAAANEQHGNYIVTAFLAASLPTGTNNNEAPHAVLTPTLAGGKGWGHFDVLSTAGIQLPVAESQKLGQSVNWNVVAQYRFLGRLTPELEMNSTFYPNGPNVGKHQIFLSPGLIVGRFPVWRRLSFTGGVGVQIAVTQFHTYNHAWILSTRLPF